MMCSLDATWRPGDVGRLSTKVSFEFFREMVPSGTSPKVIELVRLGVLEHGLPLFGGSCKVLKDVVERRVDGNGGRSGHRRRAQE